MKLIYLTLLFVFPLSFTASYAEEENTDKEKEADKAIQELIESDLTVRRAFMAKEKKFITLWGAAEDNEKLKHLKASQEAWLTWRDLEAKVLALEISEGGNLQGITEIQQKTAMNLARTKRLKTDGADLEKEAADIQVEKGISNLANFADQIGDQLVDQSSSIYQGQLGQGNKGVFILYWLPQKKVRGAFFPENGKTHYKIYGYNKVNGEINIQIYHGKKLFSSGKLTKKKTNKKLVWSGNLKANTGELSSSMTKVTTTIPQGNAKAKAYTALSGFTRDTLYLTFNKNDTVSGYAAGLESGDNEEEIYYQGVNYKNGYLFLEESGHFGDNEALVGAHLLLQKKKIQGSLVWQGFRYHHNGKVTQLSFGRTLR